MIFCFGYKNANKSIFSGRRQLPFGYTMLPAVEKHHSELADVDGISFAGLRCYQLERITPKTEEPYVNAVQFHVFFFSNY